MIKTIIFDFDGVIVESAHIKTEAFRTLFSKWPDKVDEIVSFHLKNTGISRYVKFRHFYENILHEPYSEEIGEMLGRQFSEIILEEIKNACYVNGTEEFLNKHHEKFLLFIASGTPQNELEDIVSFKGINKYFRDIYGTPATKPEIVKTIMNKYKLFRKEIIFVGDAESDKKAAEENGIYFILKVTQENININHSYKISDLTKLNEKIKEIVL